MKTDEQTKETKIIAKKKEKPIKKQKEPKKKLKKTKKKTEKTYSERTESKANGCAARATPHARAASVSL